MATAARFNRTRLFQPTRTFRRRRAFYRLSRLLAKDCRFGGVAP